MSEDLLMRGFVKGIEYAFLALQQRKLTPGELELIKADAVKTEYLKENKDASERS